MPRFRSSEDLDVSFGHFEWFVHQHAWLCCDIEAQKHDVAGVVAHQKQVIMRYPACCLVVMQNAQKPLTVQENPIVLFEYRDAASEAW